MSFSNDIRTNASSLLNTSHLHQTTLARWENLLLTLLILATLLPTAPQAILSGLVFFWLLWKGFHFRSRMQPWTLLRTSPVWPLVVAVGIAAFLQVVTMVLNFDAYPGHPPFGKSMTEMLRLVGKQGIYGMFLCAALLMAVELGWRADRVVSRLLWFLGILFLYCLVQRFWGIDWVHGLDARLPEHRHAYGFYRVSAFMGHPLTFAYNLMLIAILCNGFAIWHFERARPRLAKQWFWALCLCLACLSLTDSRWPLFSCLLLLGLSHLPRLRHARLRTKALVLATLLVAGSSWAIIFGGATIGRLGELFNPATQIEQRMPRLVFWDVHGQMVGDFPIFGVGYANRKAAALDYYVKSGYTGMERKYSAHNIYLQTLADSGLLGFMALMVLIFGLWLVARRVARGYRYKGLEVAFAAVLLAGLMQNILRDSEFLFSLWVIFGFTIACLKVESVERRSQIKNHQP